MLVLGEREPLLRKLSQTLCAGAFVVFVVRNGQRAEVALATAFGVRVKTLGEEAECRPSAQKLTVTAHDLLTIVVSDVGFTGNCAAGSTLGDDDARLIVGRIFPGDLVGLSTARHLHRHARPGGRRPPRRRRHER